jgi:hypothetical protein
MSLLKFTSNDIKKPKPYEVAKPKWYQIWMLKINLKMFMHNFSTYKMTYDLL